MKKKSDIIWVIILVAIAVLGIVRFIFMSDIFKDEKDEKTEETTVESVVSSEPEVSFPVEPAPTTSISEEEPDVSIPEKEPVQVSENEVTEEPDEEIDVEKIKKQIPQIMRNITTADCDFVFIGDSIFVFGDEDNDSIPDKLGFNYGITVYDCSRPNICAGQKSNKYVSQYDLAKCFAEGVNTDGEECDLFNYSLNRYVERDHSGRQLVIFLDCCINDYFQHTPMEGKNSFIGGYENTLITLKKTFPNAIIICVVPNDISHEEYGYNFNRAGYTYNMYKDAIYDVAVDFNVFCLRFDNADGVDRDHVREYLADGTHPGGAAREKMAEGMVNYVQSILDYVTNQ